jgi:hypothetical protein
MTHLRYSDDPFSRFSFYVVETSVGWTSQEALQQIEEVSSKLQ